MLDTSRHFETPEGITLGLAVAGPVVRAQAWLVDAAIRVLIYIACFYTLFLLGNTGAGLFSITVFLMEWFYPVLFEVLNDGATPGKKMFDIKVINDNGTPVRWSASIVRNLLRTVDFLPVFYGVGLCCTLLNRDFKRLGDMAADTLVIYNPPQQQEPELPPATATAPPLSLSLIEQRSILEFAERSPEISAERSVELAEILSPLTHQQGEAAADELRRYAHWIQGRR